MHYLIGIDGGGTKTRFQCYNTDGQLVSETVSGGTFYRQDGIAPVIDVLKSGIAIVCKDISPDDILGICFGMPGYGEDAINDPIATEKITKALYPHKIFFENDVAVGWAASFAFHPGVNIVAGTGSIGYGRDEKGNTARSGGWAVFFSDEGSGYWLGRKALELFSKQSDGRLPQGTLHKKVRMHFNLQNDFEIIPVIENQYANSRAKIASLQRILYEAAKTGDPTAINAYTEAAEELSVITCAVADQLDFFGHPVPISHVGGLFNLKELILQPMQKAISRRINATFFHPLLPPCAGAVLFVANGTMNKTSFSFFREQLLGRVPKTF